MARPRKALPARFALRRVAEYSGLGVVRAKPSDDALVDEVCDLELVYRARSRRVGSAPDSDPEWKRGAKGRSDSRGDEGGAEADEGDGSLRQAPVAVRGA